MTEGDNMTYIGSARNVRELIELLKKVDSSAMLDIQAIEDSWSYVEVWYDAGINTVIFK
jgi:hypothetical protein